MRGFNMHWAKMPANILKTEPFSTLIENKKRQEVLLFLILLSHHHELKVLSDGEYKLSINVSEWAAKLGFKRSTFLKLLEKTGAGFGLELNNLGTNRSRFLLGTPKSLSYLFENTRKSGPLDIDNRYRNRNTETVVSEDSFLKNIVDEENKKEAEHQAIKQRVIVNYKIDAGSHE